MRKIILRMAIGILLLAALGIGYITIIYPNSLRRVFLKIGVEALQVVSTEEQRDHAAHGLGMTATYPDGTWIVIYYSDRHVPGLPSIAVARDSQNHWYKSEVHYCGLFGAAKQYHRNRVMETELIKIGEMTEAERRLQPSSGDMLLATSVLGASDLATARDFLVSLGFEIFTPSREGLTEQAVPPNGP